MIDADLLARRVAFAKVGDWLLSAIESSCDDELKPAQDIISRIRCRYEHPSWLWN